MFYPNGREEQFEIRNGVVFHRWQQTHIPFDGWTNWSDWVEVDGGGPQIFVTVIADALNDDHRAEIFITTSTNEVWHKWQTVPEGGPWSAWAPMNGPTCGPIAADSNDDGRLEVFVIEKSSKHLWQIQGPSPIAKRKKDRLAASMTRRHGARWIKRVYEVDPLVNPQWSGQYVYGFYAD